MLVRFNDDTDDDDLPPVTKSGETASGQTSRSGNITGKKVENEGVFIPLSWSQLEEGPLYTPSDPEWHEFAKLSEDRDKLQKIRGEKSTRSPFTIILLRV